MTGDVAPPGEGMPEPASSCFLTKELLRLKTTLGTPEVDVGRRLPPPPLFPLNGGAGAAYLARMKNGCHF